jgi:hypothetical protein
MSLLLGAAGMVPVTDEETEALFIEDAEMRNDEEEFIPEEETSPLYDEEEDTSLDSLPERSDPMPFMPMPSFPPEKDASPPPLQQQPQTPQQPSPAAESPQPPAAEGQTQPQFPPQMPQTPQFPPPPAPPTPPPDDLVEEDEPFPGEADGGEEGLSPDEDAGEMPLDETPEDEISWDDEEESPEDAPVGEESPFGEETPEDFNENQDEVPEELFVESDETEEEPAPEEPDEPEESAPEEPVPEEPVPEESAPEEPVPEEPVPEEPVAEESVPEEAAAEEATPEEKPAPEPPPEDSEKKSKEDLLGLMKFLKAMAGSLPDKDRDTFMQSDARVSMEYIIDTLEGRKGLIKDIEQRKSAAPEVPAAATPVTEAAEAPAAPEAAPLSRMAALRAAPPRNTGKPKKRHTIADMLAFLGKLAGALPDPHLGTAISRKVNKVLSGIKPGRNKSGASEKKNGDVHE